MPLPFALPGPLAKKYPVGPISDVKQLVYPFLFAWIWLFAVIGVAIPVFSFKLGNIDWDYKCFDKPSAKSSTCDALNSHLTAAGVFYVFTILASMLAMALGVVIALGKLPAAVPVPNIICAALAGACWFMLLLSFSISAASYNSKLCDDWSNAPTDVKGVSIGGSVAMGVLAWLIAVPTAAAGFLFMSTDAADGTHQPVPNAQTEYLSSA